MSSEIKRPVWTKSVQRVELTEWESCQIVDGEKDEKDEMVRKMRKMRWWGCWPSRKSGRRAEGKQCANTAELSLQSTCELCASYNSHMDSLKVLFSDLLKLLFSMFTKRGKWSSINHLEICSLSSELMITSIPVSQWYGDTILDKFFFQNGTSIKISTYVFTL